MALNDDRFQEERPRLGCGRELDDLWASIDHPPTSHEQSCPDCRHARAALHHLASVTQAMREADPQDPGLEPGDRVRNAIMMVARAEVRRGRRAPLRTTEFGTIDISEQALTALIRFAADTLPGVRARRCTIGTSGNTLGEGRRRPVTGEAVDVGDIRIILRVAVASSVGIPSAMAALRERVGTVVQAQTSITMAQIDVVVEDLYDV